MKDGKEIVTPLPVAKKNRNANPANKRRAQRNKKSAQSTPQPAVKPVASPARIKNRHWGVLLSFLLLVAAPSGGVYWYLTERAVDQYASTVGFSVRKEDNSTAIDILGGITQLSSGGTSDSDILYEFIQSQGLVESVGKKLDLRAIWSKPANDPVFSFDASKSLEALVDYWNKMVNIFYDGGTGLIQVRVLAFDPQDANDIAQAIFADSSVMINKLSAIARADATKYAREDLDVALERLKKARSAVTEFRAREQIVDPNADIQSQMGLLGSLQKQLAESLIDLDLLRDNTRANDPRLKQSERRIEVIRQRIAEERKKFGVGSRQDPENGDPSTRNYAAIVSEYEGLIVEREFAEKTYLSALSAFESAKANALRQSRYLAAYVGPTLAQTAEYPRRLMIGGLVTLFLLLSWSILVLIYYSVRDRR